MRLGLGIMRHDVNDFNKTQEIIDYAMSHGVNYFESCNFYLEGKCESILAQALKKYLRESYYLCGKYPIYGNKDSFEEKFEAQLKNCQTSYFDIYLLQALDRNTFDEVKNNLIEKIDKVKKQKKAKFVGFSFHDTPELLEQYLKLYDWDVVQLQLNYYDWYIGYGKELYEVCKKYNKPIIVMGPAKGGTLTNGLPKEAKELLKNYNNKVSLMDWCFKFLTTLDNVKVILTGANELEMFKENCEFFQDEKNFRLKKKDVKVLQEVIRIYQKYNLIDCTGCGYCLPYCKCNLPIKKLFYEYNLGLLNKDYIYKAYDNFKSNYSSFNCIGCGQCLKHCPQGLNIPKLMKERLFQMRL